MVDSNEASGPRSSPRARGLQPGSIFGEFEVIERIGSGGMGEVFRAHDAKLGRDVALKLLPSELTADESRRARFEAETRAMAAVSHPNIVALYGAGQVDGVPYVVTELLVGHTLQTEIRKNGNVPLNRTVGIAIQIARALAAVHDRGVVHCDLKPSNIFLLEDDHVKLLDFGLARLLAPEWHPPNDEDDTPSFPNAIFGSPGFMSPEQVEGLAIDHRADIFAFGAVLYEMFWGEPAFKGPTSVDTMHSVLRDRAPRLSDVSRSSAPIERIIERCLEKRPGSRFQNAKDLLFALKHLAQVDATPAAHRSLIPRPGRRASWTIGIAAASVAAVVVTASVLRGTFGTETPSPPSIQLLTTHGKALYAAISPDGRYFAHSLFTPGGSELRLRDIESGSELLLDGPTPDILGEVIFAPDQSAIYYGRRPARDPGKDASPLALYRVPFIGGTPQKLAEGMWLGTTALSPDGRTLVYTCAIDCGGREVRTVPTSGVREPSVLFTYEGIAGACYWSDDGGSVLCPGATSRVDDKFGPSESLRFDLSTKTLTKSAHVGEHASTAPYRNHGGALVAGRMLPSDRFNQLWWLQTSGVPVRVREDLLDYTSVSVSDDGDVVAVAEKRVSNLFLHSAVTGRDTRLTTGIESLDGENGVSVCTDGTIVYASEAAGNEPSIWKLDPASRSKTRLTNWQHGDVGPDCAPDSKSIAFIRFAPDSAVGSLWRMDINGGSAEELYGDGMNIGVPSISPDGAQILFTRFSPAPEVWIVGVDGRDPRPVLENTRTAMWSPDGRLIVWGDSTDGDARLVDPVTFEVLQILPMPAGGKFSPDGTSLVVRMTGDGDTTSNLWATPLDGGEPRRLTDLPANAARFDIAPSGDIVIACHERSRDVVLLRGLLDEIIEKR